MTETLGQQYSQLADEMKKSPKTYFREQALGPYRSSHSDESLAMRNFTIHKDGDLYVPENIGGNLAWTTVSARDLELRIGACCYMSHAQIELRYRFDDTTGLGFAKSIHLYSTQDNMCSDHLDLDCDMALEELVAEPKPSKRGSNCTIIAVFDVSTPSLTHANILVTTRPPRPEPRVPQDPDSEWAAFRELPVRSVTIQMLYDWMQCTFSGQLKPLNLEKTGRYAKLREEYAPVFSEYNPTDSTLDFVESYKAKGWKLIAVNSIQSPAAQYNHDALIRNRGAENVFHYQQDAMIGRNLVGVNLYFVRA